MTTRFRCLPAPRAAVFVALLLALAGQAWAAADAPEYAVSTEAVRTGEQLSLSVKITKPLKDGAAETLAAPRVLIQEGKRAMIIVSTGPARAAGAAPPPLPSPDRTATRGTAQAPPVGDPEDVESGIRVDVISIKGKDKAIVLTTVVEKGETTWAESKTIDVTAGKTQGKP